MNVCFTKRTRKFEAKNMVRQLLWYIWAISIKISDLALTSILNTNSTELHSNTINSVYSDLFKNNVGDFLYGPNSNINVILNEKLAFYVNINHLKIYIIDNTTFTTRLLDRICVFDILYNSWDNEKSSQKHEKNDLQKTLYLHVINVSNDDPPPP